MRPVRTTNITHSLAFWQLLASIETFSANAHNGLHNGLFMSGITFV